MNSKKIILGLIVLLIIGVCIFSLSNSFLDTINMTNSSTNFTDNLTNGTISTNNSITNCGSDGEDNNIESSYNSYSKNHVNSNGNEKEEVKEYEFTAEDAMADVEQNVIFPDKFGNKLDVDVGHPKYKDKRMDSWLVPAYDKKTGKFIGSVYANGELFTNGPDNYKEYKKLVSDNK